ncbi:MAG TPA: RICIN domain-containing protein [Micromonosporaceae bacterium]|nr:RICIN domain-containing protein [Micromonosporaceae bacterium]
MPTYEEPPSPPQPDVDDLASEARQPRWLMPAAVAVGAAGVLVGVLLATGLITKGGKGGSEAGPGVGSLSDATRSASTTPQTPAATPSKSDPVSTASPSPNTAGGPQPSQAPADSESPPEQISTTSELPANVWVLRSAASSLCIDITPGEEEQGADVQQVKCSADASQQWRISGTLLNRVTLTNVASGKCLEVEELSHSNRAAVQQWSCNGGLNQLWKVTDAGDGKVVLTAAHSGKCLGVPTAEATTAGAKLRQSPCDKSLHQQWTVR